MIYWNMVSFFFSSRIRHTRSLCDWSSDVCSSDLGVPEILNADNGEHGTGAVWDFTSTLDGNTLAPGATSKARRLAFGFSTFGDPRTGDTQLIHLTARAYSR